MIIPIGHEEDTVRRLPWMTFGTMILCLLFFLLSVQFWDVDNHQAYETGVEAVEYYLEHPYLEADPALLEMMGFEGHETEALIEVAKVQFEKPEDPYELAQEQEELDDLTREALDGVREHPFQRWGLVPARPSPLAMISHMFLHAGWLHLIGNMLILYLAGPFIEDVWGRPLFLGFYLLSGIAAALTFMAFDPGSGVPMIGASGAIAGVMGAFLVRYWTTKIKFFYIIGLLWRGTFSAPSWLMLPLWFGQQLFMAMMSGSADGVAYWAHVGGFGFGLLGALGIKHWKVEERLIEPKLEGKLTTKVLDIPEVDRAMEACAASNPDRAVSMLLEQANLHPDNREIGLALWGVAIETGRAGEATASMIRVIRDDLRRGAHDEALTHWAELAERVPRLEVGADLLIRLADLQVSHGSSELAATTLRRALLAGGSEMTAATALRIARAASEIEPAISRTAARLALTRPDIDPSEKSQAESLLA